ncbi:MAG: dihydrodipicolinate reductase [Mangrovicoccus sp.]
MTTKIYLTALFLTAIALPAWAEAFRKIDRKQDFIETVKGRELRLTGIRLTVTPAGEIQGRAFGKAVTGAWRWQNGYFCRDLAWGAQEFPYNCQEVSLAGGKIRFQSDRGSGQKADFRLH